MIIINSFLQSLQNFNQWFRQRFFNLINIRNDPQYNYSDIDFGINSSQSRMRSIYLETLINKLSNDVALLKMEHKQNIFNDNNILERIVYRHNSDLNYVLQVRSNDIQTPQIFWANVVRAMLLNGVAYVYPRYENERLKDFILLNNLNFENGYFTLDDSNLRIHHNDLLIFENPKTTQTYQLQQILYIIDTALQSASMHPQSRIKGFLKIPTTINDKATADQVKKRFKTWFDTASQSQAGFLLDGEEFQELKQDIQQLDTSTLDYLVNQLYESFGINHDLLTCNYNESQFRAYYTTVLKPYENVIKQELNSKMITRTARTQGQFINIYYDFRDLASFKDTADYLSKYYYHGILNANEIRVRFLDLDPRDDGDIYYTNANAIEIERPDNQV